MPKKYPSFNNFGEYLYYAYARSALPLCCAKNLQMLHYALKDGKPRYDRMCFMILFPREKGGEDSLDNIIMVCKECNSSKRKMDLKWLNFGKPKKKHIFFGFSLNLHYLCTLNV